MVLAEVATTSEQMQDKVATVTKFMMGFDDHADVSLFPKSFLPKNFKLRSINANDEQFFFPTRVNNTSHSKSPNRPDGYDQPQDNQRVLRDYWSL